MMEDLHVSTTMMDDLGFPKSMHDHSIDQYVTSCYVYFCFWHDDFDSVEEPNRIMMNNLHPTVMDVCSMIKAIFFPGEFVVLSLQVYGSESDEYFEEDLRAVPTHRNEVLIVKVRYDKNVPKYPTTIILSQWLKEHHLPEFEILSKFLQHKITLQSLKYMKHTDLIDVGIKEWGLRVDILKAIIKTYSTTVREISVGIQVENTISVPGYITGIPTKRKYEPSPAETSFLPTRKKKRTTETKTRKIKFKDLRSLVIDDMIPVDIGSPVRCSGSDVYGVVVRNKQKTPVIRYIMKTTNKKKTGTISQFYKDTTGKPLQEKGESWSNIFFTHLHTGITLSLQGIDYLIKGPKKVISAFLYFAKDIRQQESSTTGFAKKSGELWRSLSNEERSKYKLKELIDKERFKMEKEEWTRIHQYHQNLMELHNTMRIQYDLDLPEE